VVKKVNDITRLQALVDKKKVVITKATLRDDIIIQDVKEVAIEKYADVDESAGIQGRKAEPQVQIYQIDLEHANKVLNMQDDEVEPAELREVAERKQKEDNAVKRYQSLKRKPQTEA
nr:hypothetical protein [Tanacetum cinerariifolium]